MARWRMARTIALAALAGVAVIVVIAALLLTQTDWGRERVRTFGLRQLAGLVHGNVRVARVEGNLLSGARLIDVVITDTAGRPFLSADTLALRYSFRSLLRKHLHLSDMRVVNGVMVLDQPPGEEWNFARIFPTGPPQPERGPGFGSWVLIRDMTVRDLIIVVRAEWTPSDTLSGAARQRAIAQALSSDSRKWIVPVGGGYQSISEFYDVDGYFPLMRLADPDTTVRIIEIDSLNMLALPFRPPAAHVQQFSARAVITKDSLFVNDMRVRLPDTRASGVAAYALNGSGGRVQLTLPETSFADARFLMPEAPAGGGSLQLALTTHGERMHVITSDMDLRVEGASVRGSADVQIGVGTFEFGPSNVSFADVSTRLIEKYAPAAPLRAPGTLAGHVQLSGEPTDLNVDGWTTYDEVGGPTSRIVADGRIGTRGSAFFARGLRLRFEPLYLSLIRSHVPDVPNRGALHGTTTLTGSTRTGFTLDANLVNTDPVAGRSHIFANGTVIPRDGFTARDLRLRFAPLQVALLETVQPDIPYDGVVTGTTTLNGSTGSGFMVSADLTHQSNEIGRSHVTANGRITMADGVAARGLRLGLQPLQVAVLRPFMDDLPIDGVLVGRTTVTGAPARERLAATLDVEHRGETGVSHFIGRANASWAGRGAFDIDVRVPTLSLATVGRFAPSVGLQGSASGNIVARGQLSNVTTDVRLAIDGDNGTIHTRGFFDLASARKRYDFTSTFAAFNAGAVLTRAPETRLSGTATARGAGLTPATADATLAANLVGSRAAGGPLVDSIVAQARLHDGLATVERGHVELASARGNVSGSFGLVANRSGTLRYDIEVDSASQFMDRVAIDTGFVRARPLVQARRIERARTDSAALAQRTEVQRVAVGYPPAPELAPDTFPVMRRDTIAGSLRAEGTITGNIERFDARGTAAAANFTYGANYVGTGSASYTVTGFGSPEASIHLEASGDTVLTQGFAFDSAGVKLDYTGVRDRGRGSIDVAVYQDPQRDYAMRSDFSIALDRKTLALQTLTLRFDTTQWQASHPATIEWGGPGTTIDSLELRNDEGGYLLADGELPIDGAADLRLNIEKLQLGDITGLLQDTANLTGLLDLRAHVEGTAAAPVVTGNLALVESTYRGTELPDVRGTLAYANQNLETHTEFFRGTTQLAVADAHVPVNLALSGVSGPRLHRNEPLQVELRADSLPLESLPSFTDAVSDVRGRLRGDIEVRGSINDPSFDGIAHLDLGSLRVNASGVRYHDIVGTMHLRGDTVYVDSIVAHSGGTVRASGKLALESLTRPGFDLAMVAEDVWLLDNQKGRIRADADLTIRGPFTGVVVSGNARVTSGVVYAPETRNTRVTNLDNPTLRASVDTAGLGLAVLPAPNPLMQNLEVDVQVRIDPDTWARNAQFNVEIFTPAEADPLHIRMNSAHQVLTIRGVVHANNGEYAVAGRSLELSTASATFLGGPTMDPLIELTARYHVQRKAREALIIEVHVAGNLSEPRVTLQSNAQPPLSQSDMLAYLAFGQPSSSLLSSQSSGLGGGAGGLTGLPALAQQQLASVALGAMVDQLVADIEKEGTRSGLDVFRVHAGELPAEAAFEGYFQNVVRGTEIEAGKYVMDRLYLQARGRTSTYPGVSLEYRNPIGLRWRGTWEPRYRPVTPSLSTTQSADQIRTLGVFLLYSRRF